MEYSSYSGSSSEGSIEKIERRSRPPADLLFGSSSISLGVTKQEYYGICSYRSRLISQDATRLVFFYIERILIRIRAATSAVIQLNRVV
ncbi:MAG: hypothetical protein QNJ54_21845 [Prochloraceae cyanobacterium]|nr:hypothetical protein [Prochloraceae cyanobacterium]